MFQAKTSRLAKIAQHLPAIVTEFNGMIQGETVVYIDYGNVRNWAEKAGWHVDLKRLKQFLDSFTPTPVAKFYYGTLGGNPESQKLISDVELWGYEVNTKPVKPIRLSINVASVALTSVDVIKNFIFGPLLKTFSIDLVEQINAHLKELNGKGIVYYEDLKCNFDVEIGRDLLIDAIIKPYDTFMLWSCDSDFAGPIEGLLNPEVNKNIIICGMGGMVARELNQLRAHGLRVFDVRKLKEFICWSRELPDALRNA
jgi:hypothetical protein